MTTKKKKTRRCDKRADTKESRLLKHLRETRGLSTRKVGRMIGLSASTVTHTENGRRDLTPKIILMFLDAYGFSYEEFKGMLNGDYELPECLRSECHEIIRRLDDSKIKTVINILRSF